jgi:hypothetical protein
VVVRIILSLFLLISSLVVVTTNGCGNTDSPAEEVKKMTENIDPMPGENMTEGYRTATFALG